MTAPSQLMIARLHEVKRSRDIEDALDCLLEAVSLLKSSESRLAEAVLAWRSGERPEDYPHLTGVAPGEPKDAEVCPTCGSDHSGQFCPHNATPLATGG